MAQTQKQRGERIIELKNLTKVYDGTTAVDDVNLHIRRGEFVTLLGPSGCGKTTILRMIAGFEKPTEGRIILEGADVTDTPPHLRNVNTVFQRYALFPHLNVFNNIAFGLKLKKVPAGMRAGKDGAEKQLTRKYSAQEIKEKVDNILRLVNLEDYGHRYIDSLSGGQQQRVAIARALVNDPTVLLLDEPLSALDLKMRKEMQLELKRMHTELGITFIFVTHDQEEALTMSDTVIVINDGAIQQVGTPKKIYDEPSNAFVANFIGESNILSGEMTEDFRVKFAGRIFVCEDKGFAKNEPVDLVIRPEDIHLCRPDAKEIQLSGTVTGSVFKGDYYDLTVLSGDYEFSVQVTDEWKVGADVGMFVNPGGIHIMKKTRIVNDFHGAVTDDGTVGFIDAEFECDTAGYEAGDRVHIRFPFDAVAIEDDESDGVLGGNIVSLLYKGSHYQAVIRTDDDWDIYVNTTYEWDIGDRVGVNIDKARMTLEKMTDEEVKEDDED